MTQRLAVFVRYDGVSASMNDHKTVFIPFANYDDKILYENDIKIEINSKKLKEVSNCKHLDIIIDNNVKWPDDIENITKRTIYLLFIFTNK